MTNKIVVPSFMATAFQDAQRRDASTFAGLEAALRALSENPIVPTPEQGRDLAAKTPYMEFVPVFVATEWQRRMFLAPEETLPSELIDLVHGKNEWTPADILEAFRRRQKAGK